MAPAGGDRCERVVHLLICIIAYAAGVESCGADGREVPAPHCHGRHGIGTRFGELVDGALAQHKEKRLLPPMIELGNYHRPAQGTTEVIRAGHWALLAGNKIRAGAFWQMIDTPGCRIEKFIL